MARSRSQGQAFVWPKLRQLPLSMVRADVLAGITVSLVAVPQSLAYAQLAGVPPIYGLYAAFIPTIVGALSGSSRLLSTGPVAMTSLLTAASVSHLAPQGSEQFYSYVVLLALLSGIFQLAFGLLRMGVLLNFLSHPVLMGFINAAAIIIGLSQFPTLIGIKSEHTDHFLLDIFNVLLNIKDIELITFGFGIASLLALVGFKRFMPKWPGVLITVAILTLVSYGIGYEQLGGHVVGVVPEGLPSLSVPEAPTKASIALLPAAFVIALISFMEAMSSAKVIAIHTRTPWNEDRELIGQGLAKIASAFCHSMPVSGSFSRSALNLASGAESKLSSIISALFVVMTLLFLTPLLHHLPKAVLAAIIMVAVANLVNVRIIRNAWYANVDDGIAGLTTFIATLLFAPNIQIGIVAGILLSLSLLLYRLMRPRIAVLGLKSDATLRDSGRHKLEPLGSRMAALRFDGELIFINVAYFEDALIELERKNPSISHILIKCSGMNRLDASGVEILFKLVERFKANGITLVFSGLKEQAYGVMQRSGLIEEIGPANIYPTDEYALEDLRHLWDDSQKEFGPAIGNHSLPQLQALSDTEQQDQQTVAVRPAYRGTGPMKILVPVDGSPASTRAVEVALLMARAAPEGRLVLLNAQTAVDLGGAGMTDVLMSQQLEDEEIGRAADVALRAGSELCREAGVPFETRKRRGILADLITRIAEDEEIDQIVMATETDPGGFGVFQRPSSIQIVRQSEIPITLVK